MGWARGYLNAAAATAEQFCAQSFQRCRRVERLYRTGDIARSSRGWQY